MPLSPPPHSPITARRHPVSPPSSPPTAACRRIGWSRQECALLPMRRGCRWRGLIWRELISISLSMPFLIDISLILVCQWGISIIAKKSPRRQSRGDLEEKQQGKSLKVLLDGEPSDVRRGRAHDGSFERPGRKIRSIGVGVGHGEGEDSAVTWAVGGMATVAIRPSGICRHRSVGGVARFPRRGVEGMEDAGIGVAV